LIVATHRLRLVRQKKGARLSYDDLIGTLVALRRSAGDSQQALAERLGLKQAAVGHWESKRNQLLLKNAVEWAHQYEHELVVMPGDAAATAHRLVAVAARLDQAQLETLLALAEALPRLSPTIRHLIANLAEEVGAERIAKGA
jgi:transcriptional regulator with XRE-family HTH domain